ncbi:alpha/beta hydrolase [Halioxenophilus sp. WMMB6]|uniref:alpha/beta fold hydrolase n=1 Tax=Halioxenophilus sp. WMMB6 TaxID=3073815 RepID=UPI00295F4CAF|nr:alpha/beta hydrolase [Halioxenophilus sp. WMMB6]
MKGAYIDLPEGQIHYLTEGEGEPLLLFHQAPMSSQEWVEIIPQLSGKYRVIAPDMAGHGNSFALDREYSLEDYSAITVKFMDALGLDSVMLGGWHSGAALATSVAVNHPQRVKKLLVSCEMLIGKEQIDQFLEGLKSKPLSRDLPMDKAGEFLKDAWNRYEALAPTAPLERRFRPFVLGQLARMSPYDAHVPVLEWMAKAEWITQVKCPLMVFTAEHDLFYNEALIEKAEKTLSNCQTVVMKDCGALSTFEKPDAVAAVMKEFFAG